MADSRPLLLCALDVARDFPFAGEPVRAVRGVSLDVREGEYVAIVGPSGCGKSSLLNLLGAIDRPTRGRVEIRGRDVSSMGDREATAFRLHNIGFVFQRFYLMPMLTALENVELPMAEARLAKGARRARARELLAYVGLEGRARHRPSQLSGGEQQRVAIARSLANRPGLLLADEPTGELDAKTGREMIALFGRLHADGTTILVVTHDEALARAARRVVHMIDGVIVSDELHDDSALGGAPWITSSLDDDGDASSFRSRPDHSRAAEVAGVDAAANRGADAASREGSGVAANAVRNQRGGAGGPPPTTTSHSVPDAASSIERIPNPPDASVERAGGPP